MTKRGRAAHRIVNWVRVRRGSIGSFAVTAHISLKLIGRDGNESRRLKLYPILSQKAL